MEDTTSSVLLMSKIGAMIGLGLGSLVLGILPMIVGRYRAKKRLRKHSQPISSDRFSTSTSASLPDVEGSTSAADKQGLLTSLLLCFGGGVLLFTTFLHLAPEVRESVERHQSNGQLPTLGTLGLAELLFCGGFFLVYLVEEAVHAALTGKPESSEALLYRTVSVRRCNNNQTGPSTMSGSTTTVSTTMTRSTAWKDDDDEENRADLERSRIQLDELRNEKNVGKDDKVLPAIFVLSSALSSEGHQVEKHSDPELAMSELNYQPIKHQDHRHHQHNNHHNHNHHHHHHHHHHQHGTITQNTSIQGLLTVLALSFHAIFEGLAVGLEPSISSVVYLAAAIATHKLVISFCVGMELYVAGASTRATLGYLSIFSMVTPIGIGIGLALGHLKNDSENLGTTPTILQGMAAGTLLYVVFFEVLARERANEKSGLLQLVAIIVGFTLMLGLQIATAHSHSHNHGHGHGDEEEDHDHDHDHDHEHEHDHKHLVTNAIDKVTDSIAEVLSNALTSTTTIRSRDINETSTLHPHHS
ncbi:protein zntC isoform X1 [Camponotus floridanus]|uniref:protein zntC isoform X1 n=1 Tax=Camponotus floridanus TaxID=104421 RepID=UPI00059BB392|nr:protein zntC isoform X1 [Camponotus floridanus]